MEKFKGHNINEESITRAIALFFALLGIFSLLSPLTLHLYWPGKALFWLGGLPLVWIALPEFIVFSLLSFIKGKYPSYAHRINIGMGITLLGVATLWSHLGLSGEESFSFNEFMEVFNSVRYPSGYFFASSLGGGAIGALLASLFKGGGDALVYFLSILFILAGLVTVFFPLEKRAYSLLLSKLAIRKSKANSEKERVRLEEENRKEKERERMIRPISSEIPSSPFSAEPLENHIVSNAPSFASNEPSFPKEEEEVLSKRSELYHHEDKTIAPREEKRVIDHDPSFMNSAPFSLMNAGLQEASYLPEAAFFEENRASSKKTPASIPLNEDPVANKTVALNNANSNHDFVPKQEEKKEDSFVPFDNFSAPKKEESQIPSPSPSIETNASRNVQNEAMEENRHIEPAPSIKEDVVVPEPIQSETQVISNVSSPEVAPKEESTPIMNEVEKAPTSPENDIPSSAYKAVEEEPKKKEIDYDPVTGEKFATPLPNYVYPSVDLLSSSSSNNIREEQIKECDTRKDNINEILANFKSGAHVVDYTIGPSVTRFNIETENGITVSSIKRYIQNIQVRLGGIPTRFEEVVPGQMTSGLEIANENCRPVTMKEIIESLPELSEKTKLYIPFGESISGKIIYGDLSKFPHMLISGGTGSGKSVYMQSVIMSLLMRNRPEELKLVMVDPKRVEMSKYESIPHLLCPIVKDMSQAKICIDKLCHEMERRYVIFEKAGVRDIFEYNEEYAKKKNLKTLPFIVTIIDEFADLMDTYKNVEEPVVRIAQKARAAGIHLIIATQRPTVNVVTGRLKSNLTVRVALSMNSSIDSVTILGEAGAEELAGHGDMLVSCPEVLRNGLIRAQGALVSTKEIQAVTDFIRSESKPQYDPYFLDLVDHEAEEKAKEEAALASSPTRAELRQMAGDDLYNQVKAKVMTQEYASLSRIQREFCIGFPRAGRIFSRLQKEGIVAAQAESASSSKGCRVLVHEEAKNDGLPSGSTDYSDTHGGDF